MRNEHVVYLLSNFCLHGSRCSAVVLEACTLALLLPLPGVLPRVLASPLSQRKQECNTVHAAQPLLQHIPPTMYKQGGGPGRRETRARKVSQRMAVVDESTRRQAAQSRLDALENDNPDDVPDPFGLDEDDDEFLMAESDDEEVDVGRKTRKKKTATKRKTRGALTDGRVTKTFQRLLEESGVEDEPADSVNYLTAAAGPSVCYKPRKFCSVCGFISTYTCARCGSRYCSRKCFTVHTETRCLKFMA
eukprot:GHRR01011374.1.p1 GENE.GHRR01011374.1~~GHRR01011374.1.p1  ORF type:complete len:247 (+),score=40.53 GHRR01011374.1:13-753(+)